ncbi:hypothetical protein ACLI1A_17165 [Flavobacterium sp. RHBU_3]|uniref:hypothetical protein n=1 Tax=Flavobacterium sp. RHBU_3 TaxID=3391184 RepID=UPI00398548BE
MQNFKTDVANSTAHRPSREGLANRVLADAQLLPELLSIAFDTKNKSHHKACWILELVLENNIALISPYLDEFCNTAKSYNHEGAIRSISKICLFLAQQNHTTPVTLNQQQKELITETCFDWLIAPDGKVASKAYAMRALYLLGKDTDWVYTELQRILQDDFTKHTAAYKAAAKELLQKLKNS